MSCVRESPPRRTLPNKNVEGKLRFRFNVQTDVHTQNELPFIPLQIPQEDRSPGLSFPVVHTTPFAAPERAQVQQSGEKTTDAAVPWYRTTTGVLSAVGLLLSIMVVAALSTFLATQDVMRSPPPPVSNLPALPPPAVVSPGAEAVRPAVAATTTRTPRWWWSGWWAEWRPLRRPVSVGIAAATGAFGASASSIPVVATLAKIGAASRSGSLPMMPSVVSKADV